ncbi:hypothetical protein GJAV_G00104670 [Gymnothorax javanicus]|nr:hypothetical protein GJAV_G00104670 [Gymnothorax javanicus]
MSDSNLFMECEEEELELWQQTRDIVKEEVPSFAVNKRATSVATKSHSLASAPPVCTVSAAPPATPTALQPPPVFMTVDVSSGLNVKEEPAAAVPCSTVPESTTAPTPPPAPPVPAVELLRPLVSPSVPHLQPAQQLILTKTPVPPGKLPLPKVLHPAKPANIATGQPIILTTQGLSFQGAVAGQNTINAVGFLLNGQAYTLSCASGTQLFKPAIPQAPPKPTNLRPVTTATNLLPATVVTSRLQETMANGQVATTLASGETAILAASEQASIRITDRQPAAFVSFGQPGIPTANQQPGISTANEQGGTASSSEQAETSVSIELPGIAAANEQPATSAANQHPLKSFAKQIPTTIAFQSSSSITQGGKPSTLNAKPGHTSFILPKVEDDVQEKWRNLQEKYRKQRIAERKRRSKSVADPKKKKKCMPLLRFAEPCVQERPTCSSAGHVAGPETNGLAALQAKPAAAKVPSCRTAVSDLKRPGTPERNFCRTGPFESSCSPTWCPPSPEPLQGKCGRCHPKRGHSQLSEFEAEVLRLFSNHLDEDDYFGCSLAQTLKRLPPKKKRLLRCRIEQLVYDVEFGDGQ